MTDEVDGKIIIIQINYLNYPQYKKEVVAPIALNFDILEIRKQM